MANIDLVVFPGEILTAVEHPSAQVCLHLDPRVEEADPPQEAARRHEQDDEDHGQADPIQQEVHVEGNIDVQTIHVLHGHVALFDSVDDHTVQRRHLELEEVDDHQGQNTQQKGGQMLEIVPIDVLSEKHGFTSFRLFFSNTAENGILHNVSTLYHIAGNLSRGLSKTVRTIFGTLG